VGPPIRFHCEAARVRRGGFAAMSLLPPSLFRALRHRNFRLFMLGQLVSVSGTEMQNIAAGWLAYRLTRSAFLLGLIAFSGRILVLFLAPIAGVVADRINKHRLVLATQALLMAQAALLAWMTLSGRIEPWHLVVFAAASGAVNAFDTPARQSFLIDLVGRADLGNAIALNSSMFNLARFIGPGLAGVIVASLGEGIAFLLNALSFVAVIGGLVRMRLACSASSAADATPWASLREGIGFVRRTPPIRDALFLLGVMSFAGIPYLVLMPIVSGEVLGAGAEGLGTLMAAAGLGALAGALGLAARVGLRGLGRLLVVAVFTLGVALILLGSSRSYPLSLLVMPLTGWGMMVTMAGTNTLVQSLVPDALRGRVMSLYTVTFLGVSPFGSLALGWLASHLGTPLTIALGGIVCVIAALVFLRRLPRIRAEIRQVRQSDPAVPEAVV
jgi:MFS family permease